MKAATADSLPRPRHTLGMHRQRGQSMVEYLVASIVVVALIVAASAGEPPAYQKVLDAIKLAYANYSYALSLPF